MTGAINTKQANSRVGTQVFIPKLWFRYVKAQSTTYH